jgi:hypothetical protein
MTTRPETTVALPNRHPRAGDAQEPVDGRGDAPRAKTGKAPAPGRKATGIAVAPAKAARKASLQAKSPAKRARKAAPKTAEPATPVTSMETAVPSDT